MSPKAVGLQASQLAEVVQGSSHRRVYAAGLGGPQPVELGQAERQRSNIPSRLLDLRSRMAQALGLAEERLPFAGEVVQVKADQLPWQGAIERVLGGFARSILVDDKHYTAVSSWLEEQNTGERLFYHRMLAQQACNRSPGASSLVRKLDIAPGLDRDMAGWLQSLTLVGDAGLGKSRLRREFASRLTACLDTPSSRATSAFAILRFSVRASSIRRTPMASKSRFVPTYQLR
jgi:hypothetical protein